MSGKFFSVGVIISTYNNPQWLRKTLWGYEQQTHRPDEVIIADDGSGKETAEMIEAFKEESTLNIKHVWQSDEGFRKNSILNKAILAAGADYLIFTDQDCIPRGDFIATHCHYARPGFFLSGGYYKLPMKISLLITRDDIATQKAFSPAGLAGQGLKRNFKLLKLTQSGWLASLMNHVTTAKATFNGCNSSCWREDALAIGGFNETMNYGGEDREFGERLFNKGIRSKQIRYSAACVHLDHNRPYKPSNTELNRNIRRETRRKRIIVTPDGIR